METKKNKELKICLRKLRKDRHGTPECMQPCEEYGLKYECELYINSGDKEK